VEVVPLPAVELVVPPTPVVLPDVLHGPATVPVVPDVPIVPEVPAEPVVVPGFAVVPVPTLPLVEGVVVEPWEGVVVGL
jgi:hypothetical protein